MRGLMLKDYYMIIKYYKMYLVLIIAFSFFSISSDNSFFLVYPCLLAGMIPVSLISYEEKERWNQYLGTLPCSRAQIVSVKYIMGLLLSLASFFLTMVVQSIGLIKAGIFSMEIISSMSLMLINIICLVPTFALPFIFKLGSEKGRFVYIVIIGLMTAAVTVVNVSGSMSEFSRAFAGLHFHPAAVCGILILLYILSWQISIWIYNRKEL